MPLSLTRIAGIRPVSSRKQTTEIGILSDSCWCFLSSQWDMAFSMAPSTVSTNSPPMAMDNSVQGVQAPLAGQYPIQYGQTTKVTPVTPPQAISPPQFNGQQVLFTARDWQQSVASVYDPNGLKRRWNYSVDMGTEHTQKRARWVFSIYIDPGNYLSCSMLGESCCMNDLCDIDIFRSKIPLVFIYPLSL